MRSVTVIELKPLFQAGTQLCPVFVCIQVNVLILEGPPQPFDENVVLGAAPAVHADSDIVRQKRANKLLVGKLGVPGQC